MSGTAVATNTRLVQHSTGAIITDDDLSGALAVIDETYHVVPGSVTDEQIAAAVQGGDECCYVACIALGGLLVGCESNDDGICRADVADPVTDMRLAVFDRGEGTGRYDCGEGPLDALTCAVERARAIMAERAGGAR